MFVRRIVLITGLILSGAVISIYGQSNWSLNASMQYASGTYLSTERLNSYYIFGGVRYETGSYSLALSIPFIISNGQNVSQLGNIYIPNHMGSGSIGMSGSGGPGGRHMIGNGSLISTSSSENSGIGDLYLYANYNLLNQFTSHVGLALGGYIKFPTASAANGFGTGKFDFSLSTTLRKSFGSFLGFVSGGYIILGQPDSVNYLNPFTLNAGLGKFFDEGNLSVLLSYSLYSRILDLYELPQELSLGVNLISNDKITYTIIGSAGLSNSTPDYVLSGGIKYNL